MTLLPVDASVVLKKRRGRAPVLIIAAGAIVVAIVLLAVLGQFFTPQDPYVQDLELGPSGPSSAHLLGTDQLGRDILSRLMVGAVPALVGPLMVALGTLLLGGSLGLLAGYRGGRIDTVVARVADVVYSMPALLIAIVVVGVISGSYLVTTFVLIVLSFPGLFRLVRSASQVQSRMLYVDAAKTLGVSQTTILRRHILPNVMPTVVASFLLDFVGALIWFSALAFLGLGVQPGGPDWGTVLSDGQELIFQNPLMSISPAILIVLTATSVTLLGDWVYDRLSRATAPE